jgi:peptidyl-prolyl cis-trans isomerase SurA
MNIPRGIVLAVVLALAGWGAQAELVNGVKAIVHDSVITYDEVNGSARPAAQLLQQQFRNDPEGFRKKLGAVIEENLDQLVERQLILRDFEQAGYNFPDSIVDEALQEEVRTRFNGDRATFAKTLQAEGITVEKYRQRLHDQLVVGALRSKNISRELVVSPHKIEKYYLENRDKYKVEDEVKLRMIVLNKSASTEAPPARLLAGEILAKLKEGAAFSEMASVYSQGSQRSQGGDWGWVEKSVLRKELAEVAFKLKAGERSEVIELPEACYLMLVEDVRPAHVRPLGEIREEIERNLLTEERARLQKRYIEKLRTKTFVRYF